MLFTISHILKIKINLSLDQLIIFYPDFYQQTQKPLIFQPPMDSFLSKSKIFFKNIENSKNELKKKIEAKYQDYKHSQELKASHPAAQLKKKLHSKTFSKFAQFFLDNPPLPLTHPSLFNKQAKKPLSLIFQQDLLLFSYSEIFSEGRLGLIKEYCHSKGGKGLECIVVVGFHHKKGAMIEFMYPEGNRGEEFEEFLTSVALPDAVHQNDVILC